MFSPSFFWWRGFFLWRNGFLVQEKFGSACHAFSGDNGEENADIPISIFSYIGGCPENSPKNFG